MNWHPHLVHLPNHVTRRYVIIIMGSYNILQITWRCIHLWRLQLRYCQRFICTVTIPLLSFLFVNYGVLAPQHSSFIITHCIFGHIRILDFKWFLTVSQIGLNSWIAISSQLLGLIICRVNFIRIYSSYLAIRAISTITLRNWLSLYWLHYLIVLGPSIRNQFGVRVVWIGDLRHDFWTTSSIIDALICWHDALNLRNDVTLALYQHVGCITLFCGDLSFGVHNVFDQFLITVYIHLLCLNGLGWDFA